jgi:hypothetical protein
VTPRQNPKSHFAHAKTNLGQRRFGGGGQFVTIVRSLNGQQRVATRDESFVRVVRVGELGQVSLVEE